MPFEVFVIFAVWTCESYFVLTCVPDFLPVNWSECKLFFDNRTQVEYNHNNMREFQLAVTALDCVKDLGLTLINTMKRKVYISPNSI